MIHSEKLNYIEPYNVLSREVFKMWVNHSVVVYCKFYKEFYKALSNHTFISKLHSASELTRAINKLPACCVYNCSGWLFSEPKPVFAHKYLSVYCGLKSSINRRAFFLSCKEEAVFVSSYWNDVHVSRDLHTSISSFRDLL